MAALKAVPQQEFKNISNTGSTVALRAQLPKMTPLRKL
jgi:hypothetical protein